MSPFSTLVTDSIYVLTLVFQPTFAVQRRNSQYALMNYTGFYRSDHNDAMPVFCYNLRCLYP